MKYNSVISAISKYLKLLSIDKTSIRRSLSPCLPAYFEPILIVEKCTKIIYNYLNVKEVNTTTIEKCKQELNIYGDVTVAVKDIFKVCFKTTCDSTLQWLQFRILYRLLPVGYYLKKISIKSTDCCRFCDKNVETILHIFTSCEKTQPLWSELSLYIYRKTHERVGFNVSNIIFGKFPLSSYNKVINFIILHVKQYIFTCLLQNNMPNLCGLLCYLNIKYKVEKYAANQSFRCHIFEKQWSLFENMFEE